MALQDRTGQKVPSVVFRTRVGDTWKDVSTDDLFKGKKVVVFSLPGAFTPTCSSSHLPRYNELFGAFKENGVDAIYCVSVNDTFVMNAWAAEEEADNIYMIPDGNGEFTEGMGMLVGKEDLGFGKRSIKANHSLDDYSARDLLFQLSQCDNPYNCPHGRPVLVNFTKSDMEKMFRRIQENHTSLRELGKY